MPQHLSQSTHLIAILLVAKSHAGSPKLVFHYPPTPNRPSPALFSTSASTAPAWYGGASSAADTADASSESGWGEGDTSSEEDGGEDGDVASKSGRGSTAGGKSSGVKGRGIWSREVDEDEDEGTGMNGSGYDLGREAMSNNAKAVGKNGAVKEGLGMEWDRILGFRRESLEKILSPHRAFHKRKFDLGIDGCFYVGAPMFVREDGLWRKKRRREKKHKDQGRQESYVPSGFKVKSDEEGDIEDEGVNVELPESPISPPPIFAPGYGHSAAASDAGSTGLDNDMSMFHVVFVMNPPALECQARIKEMYENVARRFAKSLKHEQAKSDFVWRESKRILAIKLKGRENRSSISTVWPTIISSSSLAKSIAIIYDSISNSKIAHIHLENNEASFQIPQAVSTPYIPTATEPQMPGLWLTTANVEDDDDAETPFTQRFALLLLEDPETLIKEIEGDIRDHSSPLAFYIRSLVPTKSLHKLSVTQSIPSQDIEFIADHLLYWRRARLIPPLHHRDTYIVSPNADMRALADAIPVYAARFPTLPSLPQMLHMLSGTPRPYFTFFPSPDHRFRYMEILAWLMRGGWVTQLRSFAWVRVTPEIKAEVAAIIARENHEEAEAAAAAAAMAEHHHDSGRLSALSDHLASTSIASPSPTRRHGNNANPSPTRSPVRPSSKASTASSSRTATAELRAANTTSPTLNPSVGGTLKRPSPLHFQHRAASSPEEPITAKHSPQIPPTPSALAPHIPLPPTPSLPPANYANGDTDEFDPSNYRPSLILSPLRASSVEARYLERIRERIREKEVRELWPVLLKYLDGRRALEDIAVREGVKRKRVLAVLGILREGGWLVGVRHW